MVGVELCRMVSNDRTCGHTWHLFGNYNTIFLARAHSCAPLPLQLELGLKYEKDLKGTVWARDHVPLVLWMLCGCAVFTPHTPTLG